MTWMASREKGGWPSGPIFADPKETVMLTPAEYEAQRRRLEADAEDARKALNAARRRYEAVCGELTELRRAQNKAAS